MASPVKCWKMEASKIWKMAWGTLTTFQRSSKLLPLVHKVTLIHCIPLSNRMTCLPYPRVWIRSSAIRKRMAIHRWDILSRNRFSPTISRTQISSKRAKEIEMPLSRGRGNLTAWRPGMLRGQMLPRSRSIKWFPDVTRQWKMIRKVWAASIIIRTIIKNWKNQSKLII